jgi:hypothetical protein
MVMAAAIAIALTAAMAKAHGDVLAPSRAIGGS